jgi:hypothetical protein
MTKPCHVVFTTIYVPHVLEELRLNAERYGHLDQIKVWVVGDRKTPPEARQLSAEVSRKGLETVFLGIEEQYAWGAMFQEFYCCLPYNNETRRNLGYLRALEDGCETLICINDNNFPTADDFFGGHMHTGQAVAGVLIQEPTGYHNVCEYLQIQPSRPLFPRGFPLRLRGQSNAPQLYAPPAGARIGVTAGLWLKEPDIDATAWLNGRVESVGYTGPEHFVLNQETWSPINTQNTSVTRELVPGFLCVPMGHEFPGGKFQRYGDIWGGYFLQAVMRGTPFYTSFGLPLVEHRRNPHNYVDDLRHEYWGMILTDWISDLLRTEFRPSSSSVADRVFELGEFLRSTACAKVPEWCPPAVKQFLLSTADSLRKWATVCQIMEGRRTSMLPATGSLPRRRSKYPGPQRAARRPLEQPWLAALTGPRRRGELSRPLPSAV